MHKTTNLYQQHTSSFSCLALCLWGRARNSLDSRMHSFILSGDTKSSATFIHDCKQNPKPYQTNKTYQNKIVTSRVYTHTFRFLTWWGHPAGIRTASPTFWTKLQGSMPALKKKKKQSYLLCHNSKYLTST